METYKVKTVNGGVVEMPESEARTLAYLIQDKDETEELENYFSSTNVASMCVLTPNECDCFLEKMKARYDHCFTTDISKDEQIESAFDYALNELHSDYANIDSETAEKLFGDNWQEEVNKRVNLW